MHGVGRGIGGVRIARRIFPSKEEGGEGVVHSVTADSSVRTRLSGYCRKKVQQKHERGPEAVEVW